MESKIEKLFTNEVSQDEMRKINGGCWSCTNGCKSCCVSGQVATQALK